MSTRDSQRQRLYDAEDWAGLVSRDGSPPKYGRSFGTVPECQAYVDAILAKRWFKAAYTAQEVEVKPGFGHRRATGFRFDAYGGTIQLPRWSRHEGVILHELAHVVVGNRLVAWHGREFAKVYHHLVSRVMGEEAADALLLGSIRYNVRIGKRRPTFKTMDPQSANHIALGLGQDTLPEHAGDGTVFYRVQGVSSANNHYEVETLRYHHNYRHAVRYASAKSKILPETYEVEIFKLVREFEKRTPDRPVVEGEWVDHGAMHHRFYGKGA